MCAAQPGAGWVGWLVAAGSGLGTFKSILSSLPSSPAASPAALAATGGLAGMAPKLATAGDAKFGHAGPAKTPEVALLGTAAAGVHRVGRCMMGIGRGGWPAEHYFYYICSLLSEMASSLYNLAVVAADQLRCAGRNQGTRPVAASASELVIIGRQGREGGVRTDPKVSEPSNHQKPLGTPTSISMEMVRKQ